MRRKNSAAPEGPSSDAQGEDFAAQKGPDALTGKIRGEKGRTTRRLRMFGELWTTKERIKVMVRRRVDCIQVKVRKLDLRQGGEMLYAVIANSSPRKFNS